MFVPQSHPNISQPWRNLRTHLHKAHVIIIVFRMKIENRYLDIFNRFLYNIV